MIENVNKMLEENDIMVRIGTMWYKLDEVFVVDGKMPIFVSDDDGGEHEFDILDIDEFDPIVESFKELDMNNIGVA